MQVLSMPTKWKAVKDARAACQLIDMGVLLQWKDMRQMQRQMSADDLEKICRHFATRLAERVNDRLPEEILIESLMVFLFHANDDRIINAFLEELLVQPNNAEACMTLVEVGITAEISDVDHSEDIFAMAVGLICELGLAVMAIQERYPDEFPEARDVLDQISTYLLSVSNSNNSRIRLHLIRYFGVAESRSIEKPGFNRVMGRFGHTVLEQLFNMLFNKKTEAVALQYLLENLPYVMEGDNHCQNILHETWKYYMLKKPERFALFVQTLSREMQSRDGSASGRARKVYMQHLGVLLRVISDVNHRDLGREIMCGLAGFEKGRDRDELIGMIMEDEGVRQSFKELLGRLLDAPDRDQVLEESVSFRSTRRGRKPSFARVENLRPISQVAYLGQRQEIKAS